jgi:serine/threonine protein kinase
VCQYKHYFEDGENCYILLELCQNQSLNEMIKRRKSLTEPEVAFFMKQLVEATRYMHSVNVIHRDLKLGNLFLDGEMNIKVGDLGLATKVTDKDEKRKTICGTPNYIAPEIIQGDKATRGHSFEVDIWSMGVILYTLLVGKPPYEAKDVKATYQRILNNEYAFPRHVDISNAAKSLIRSMLQSKPSDRPTLDEVDQHPFLNEHHIPLQLPSSVLSIVPDWRMNEDGNLVCYHGNVHEKHGAVAGKSLMSASRGGGSSSSSTHRQPFLSHDFNKNAPPPPLRANTESVNIEKVAKSALAVISGQKSWFGAGSALSSLKTPVSSSSSSSTAVGAAASTIGAATGSSDAKKMPLLGSAFKVFEEPTNRKDGVFAKTPKASPGGAFSATLVEDALIEKTRALSLNRQTLSVVASTVVTKAESVVSNANETDGDVLQKLVDQVDRVIAVGRSDAVKSSSPKLAPYSLKSGPAKWVSRYVDYSSKYGLGFLMNDGGSGVYFNDSTKVALQAHGDTFQYIERKKSDAQGKRRGDVTQSTYTLNVFPDELKKKVTLLKHFRNYLIQQKGSDGGNDDDVNDDSQHYVDSTYRPASEYCYVKKWVRTNHTIVFYLSNRTVQIIFYDQSELLFPPEATHLTFVDKNGVRATYNFTPEIVGALPDLEKRLKIAKEILLHLLSGQQQQRTS